MSDFGTAFGERLSDLMEDRHKSAQDVANELQRRGYYPTLKPTALRKKISQWENGDKYRTPSVEDIIILADYFNVPADYLLGRKARLDEDTVKDLSIALGIDEDAIKNLIRLSRDSNTAELFETMIATAGFSDIMQSFSDTKTELTKLYRQIESCDSNSPRELRFIEHQTKIAKGYLADSIEKTVHALCALLGYDRFEELMKGSETDGE